MTATFCKQQRLLHEEILGLIPSGVVLVEDSIFHKLVITPTNTRRALALTIHASHGFCVSIVNLLSVGPILISGLIPPNTDLRSSRLQCTADILDVPLTFDFVQ